MDNYFVPFVSYGGTREEFFKLTPKTIKYYFKAFKMKTLRDNQLAWLNGLYIKQALQSSVLIAGLADKKVVSKMPKYPEMPKDEPKSKNEKFETEYLIAKMDRLMRNINAQNKKKGG